MTTHEAPHDELEMRIRALEAERLRPTPDPPNTPTPDDIQRAKRRLRAFEKRLQRIGQRHHPHTEDQEEDH